MKKCSVEELDEALKSGRCRVLDVREPAEFEAERIEGAELFPLSRWNEKAAGSLGKDKPVFLICRSGARACQAGERLKKLGFSDIYTLDGGLRAWSEAGKPVIKGQSRVWGLERQVRFAAGFLVLSGLALSLLNPYWLALPAFVAAGLVFSAVTDTCGMAMLLARMPWNKR